MTQADIRAAVTERIVAALRAGTPPWRRPWSAETDPGLPANVVTRKAYRGVNPLLLGLTAGERGYNSRWWGTFEQWRGLGCRVKERPAGVPPGGWGVKAVLLKPVQKPVAAEDGEERTAEFVLLRWFTLFNAAQVEGGDHWMPSARPRPAVIDFGPAEAAVRATGAVVRHGGERAAYSPAADVIFMPDRRGFRTPAGYYGTLLHELGHWTGHPCRLNRLDRTARFGDAAYAVEELVAEIAGCYLAAELHVPQADDVAHGAAYLASWLRVLDQDHRAIFTAAAQASAACDFVLAAGRLSPEVSSGQGAIHAA